MSKYIDAEKLIAEIERRKNESRELAQEHKDSSLGNAAQTMANEDEEILSIIDSLQQEQPDLPSGEDVMTMCNQILIDWVKEGKTPEEVESRKEAHSRFFELYDEYLMPEQPEVVDLEKEIARFALNGGTGDNTPTIGETARHFYELGQSTQYQKDRGEFAKLKAKEWQDGFNNGVNARKEEKK